MYKDSYQIQYPRDGLDHNSGLGLCAALFLIWQMNSWDSVENIETSTGTTVSDKENSVSETVVTADGKPDDGAEWCQGDDESHFGSDYDKTDNSALSKHARQMQTWLSYVAQLADLFTNLSAGKASDGLGPSGEETPNDNHAAELEKHKMEEMAEAILENMKKLKKKS